MVAFRRIIINFVIVAVLVFVFQSKSFSGQAGGKFVSAVYPEAARHLKIPDEDSIVDFVGKVTFDFPLGVRRKSVLVSDRILDGLQVASGPLKLSNSAIISWGFEYQYGPVESVVVSDSAGRVRIIGAVNNITRLTGGYSPPITTMQRYQNRIKDEGGRIASVQLFVRDERDIAAYLPLVKRWLQADLLGFNVDCESQNMIEACNLAKKIEIPIAAYQIVGQGKSATQLRALSVPDLPAATVPIKLFTQ